MNLNQRVSELFSKVFLVIFKVKSFEEKRVQGFNIVFNVVNEIGLLKSIEKDLNHKFLSIKNHKLVFAWAFQFETLIFSLVGYAFCW
jgi:hypothetical protein